jgi:hypothetical protein
MTRLDVRVDAGDVAQGHVAGRVEHVVSGQAMHFSSLQELGFIAQVLAQGLNKEG